jgi:hypothetical protein
VSTASDQRQTYVLRARPPVRALAIASLGALVGAVVIVLAETFGLPVVVLVLGILILAAAVALAVAGLLLTARLKTTVVVGPTGMEISRGSQRRELAWSEITGVDLTATHILVRTGKERGAEVANPRGSSDPEVSRLLASLRSALDADRGYQPYQPD